MNMVMLDGVISSSIESVPDARRALARFVLATKEGARVGVEIRGAEVERLTREWNAGDKVHVRGRITTAGFVAADFVRRMREKRPMAARAFQATLPLFRCDGLFPKALAC